MSTQSERDALLEDLVRRIRQQLETQQPDTNQTLDEIEDLAGRVGQEVSQQIQKHLTQQQAKRTPRNQQQCSCGLLARYKG